MHHFLQGFMVGIGMITALVIIVILILIISAIVKRDKYTAIDLLKPFNDYLNNLIKTENYELIPITKAILKDLEKGFINKNVSKFNIKKNIDVDIDTKGDSFKIKTNTFYTIIGLKYVKENNKSVNNGKN